MHITKRSFCDFAIFTEVDSHIERIEYDKIFFSKSCLPKLAKVYFLSILPELVLENYRTGKQIIDLTRRKENEIISFLHSKFEYKYN